MPQVKLPGLHEADGVIFRDVPAGTYPVEIRKVTHQKTSDASKTPGMVMYRIQLQVLEDHEHGGHIFFENQLIPFAETESGEWVFYNDPDWDGRPVVDGKPVKLDDDRVERLKQEIAQWYIATEYPRDPDGSFDLEELQGEKLAVRVDRVQATDYKTRKKLPGKFENPVKDKLLLRAYEEEQAEKDLDE